MHYQSGDFPAEPIEVDGFDLDPSYSAVSAKLYQEDGQMVSDLGVHEFDETRVAFIPFLDPLYNEGLYQVRLTARAVTDESSLRTKALTPISIVVESSTGSGWHTLATARQEWAGAPDDDVTLYQLLRIAKSDCQQYAPFYTDDSTPPPRALQAQIMQARDTANSGSISPGGDGGPGSFIIRPAQLSWRVQTLLRPKRGRPTVG